MGIIERLSAARDAFFSPRAENSITTSQGLAEEIWRQTGTAAGQTVNATTAERLTAVGRCVRLLSTTIATTPLVVYEWTGADRSRKVVARDTRLYKLLHDRPNEWQTAYQWRAVMQRDLELRGNAFTMIVRGVSGRVAELLRLHPDQVRVKQDDRTLAVTYDYTRADGRRVSIPRNEMLHIWFESDDGLNGLSPIQMHRETLGDSLAVQRHGSRFFSNAAKPSGVVEFDAPMGKQSMKDFRTDWDGAYSGTDNAYRTLMLPYGLKFKPLSVTNEDSQYIEQRKFNVTEIARIFGVPPHKIADLEKATFSNIEHLAIEYVQDAIVPRATGWEKSIDRDLMDNDPNRFSKFNVDVLLRGDSKARSEALEIQRRNGVINANEWRDVEDMNRRDDPGGDEYIVEANMRAQDGRPPPPPNGT